MIKSRSIPALILSFIFFTVAVRGYELAYAADEYHIENVKGNVYRFIDNRHRSLFLVTKEGILVTDPLNTAAATWLQKEFQKCFNLPVRYVVYSHNHSDHIYGAEVFKDAGSIIVSSQLAQQDIITSQAMTVVPDISFTDKMTIRLGDNEVELRYHGPMMVVAL